MNVELIDIKENQDFLVLEQINSEFKGIILVFSSDNPIGYIVYDYDCNGWIFTNCINIGNYIADDYDSLVNLINWIKKIIHNVSIKAINFSEYE